MSWSYNESNDSSSDEEEVSGFQKVKKDGRKKRKLQKITLNKADEHLHGGKHQRFTRYNCMPFFMIKEQEQLKKLEEKANQKKDPNNL